MNFLTKKQKKMVGNLQLSVLIHSFMKQKKALFKSVSKHRKVLIDVKLQAPWQKWKKMRNTAVSVSKVRTIDA